MSEVDSFWYWLRRQRKRQDPVGDLARDLFSDTELGGGDHGFEFLKRYLERLDAMPEVLEALDRAWAEYVEGVLRR